MTVAPCTTLSSRAAIASGRCFPSAFGMYVRPARRLRSIGFPVDPSLQILDPGFEVRLIVMLRYAIHAGGGFAIDLHRHADVNPVRGAAVWRQNRGFFNKIVLGESPEASAPVGANSNVPLPVPFVSQRPSSPAVFWPSKRTMFGSTAHLHSHYGRCRPLALPTGDLVASIRRTKLSLLVE
jgi:hypothetical protein